MTDRSSVWSRGGRGAAGLVSPSRASRGGNRSGSNIDEISMNGLKMAKGQIGRIPSEMELLASPSRGLDTDENASLTNEAVQEKFRSHIAEKLTKFDEEYKGLDVDPASRASALSIILLDFRKLREGITASGRNDLFTAEVYESSARLAISSGDMQQLQTCLPHLVFSAHPSLLLPPPTTPAISKLDVADELASLSLAPPPSTAVIIPELHSFYQSLYLLQLISYLAELSAFHTALSTFVPSSSSSSTSNLPPDLQFVNQIYTCLISSNYTSLSRLIYPPTSAFAPRTKITSSSSLPPLSPVVKLNLQLSVIRSSIPKWRERAWERIERSYKVFDDFAWLGRALLFEEGDEKGVKEFLKAKGRGI